MEKDPVCGMDVAKHDAKHVTVHEGKAFFFCAPGCKKAFEADSQKYLDPGYEASMPGM